MTAPSKPISIPDNKIYAYVLPGAPEDAKSWIRPCKTKRDWMDDTPARYAYRCIPLSAANSMGWEILNPVNCEFRWTGLTPHQQLYVYREKEHRFAPKSHFGSGVVTWELPFLFRTPADFGLVVTGPANQERAHITPLDGFVRTDWLPFPFTINWRLTSADQTIRVNAGEPIARVFPYPIKVLEEFSMELHDLNEDPAFQRQFMAWGQQRQNNYQRRESAAKAMHQGQLDVDLKELWDRQYAHGQGSDDSSEHQHKTVFKCPVVKDERNGDKS